MSSMNRLPLDFVLLIPCYNNQNGLLTSLKSISYPPEKFEVLIIDDGSTVPVNEKELQDQLKGVVIRVHRLEKNKGIVHALNTGLNLLRSRKDVNYVARLDAGDTCHEQRFLKQVEFLNVHADVALLATWARFQSTTSTAGYDYITETTQAEILKEMHYKCSFIHPSVMFRKAVLDTIGVYPENYPHAEDYAFFWKIIKSYQGAVLAEKLVQISYSDKNVSAENYKKQLRSRKKVVKKFGTSSLHQLIGIGMLNLKLLLPKRIIQKLKTE